MMLNAKWSNPPEIRITLGPPFSITLTSYSISHSFRHDSKLIITPFSVADRVLWRETFHLAQQQSILIQQRKKHKKMIMTKKKHIFSFPQPSVVGISCVCVLVGWLVWGEQQQNIYNRDANYTNSTSSLSLHGGSHTFRCVQSIESREFRSFCGWQRFSFIWKSFVNR